MKEHYLSKINDDFSNAREKLNTLKAQGKTIVFTNGCFDILHAGHLQYLNEARQLGDFLVLGINDDASVERLKGSKRPILPLQERMEILSGLEMVNMLIPFAEDTPLDLIENVSPHILVKGGDYIAEEIVGYEYVKNKGGHVKILSFKDGSSTTSIIEKILKVYNDENS